MNECKVLVGIATTGRPGLLSKVVKLLLSQDYQDQRLVICPGTQSDIEPWLEDNEDIEIVYGKKGAASQRNRILETLEDENIVFFFDDDFVPASNYISEIVSILKQQKEICAITGKVIQDGAKSPGISFADARKIVKNYSSHKEKSSALYDFHSTYGCNMAFDAQEIRRLNLRFDENLPLYSWLEDVDFSNALASATGKRIVKYEAAFGVHMGDKKGKTSGYNFGYSQIANPIYMIRKGTITRRRATRLMVGNIIANTLRSISPEVYIDRVGRLKGNIQGIADLITGKIDPLKICKTNNAA